MAASPTPRPWLPLALAAGCVALAFAQDPGLAISDTKIDLHVAPGRFLGDVAAAWNRSGGLGQVDVGQHAGYLFPMGPFFALGHGLGLAEWVVHRLWLALVLALAAWGAVRLVDVTYSRERGVAHAVAGALMVLNPYVAIYASRTSVTLFAYAALPWLLAFVVRGVREPDSWRWPAAAALVVAVAGGGVNAAVTAWMLTAPLLLLLWEATYGGAGRRAVLRFGGRAAGLAALASAWWVVPAAIHAGYGINLLPFTETVGAIWTSTSLSESLRLMGYWVTYLGIGYTPANVPVYETLDPLLFSAAAVVATLLVPAAALAGFVWTRRWSHGPFFFGLALLGALIMSVGWPEGAPMRHTLEALYYRIEPLQFLRTTHKAGPLLAVALACLAGVGAAMAWRRLVARPVARFAATLAGIAVIAGAAWPLVSGNAVDPRHTWERIPPAWEGAAAELDHELPAGTRGLILPGQLFPYYRFAGTQDALLPALSRRPVALRSAVPYSDLRAIDLLRTIDSLVQQRRLLPGQLLPLLRLTSAGAVVTGSDDDLVRSGAIAPPAAAELLEGRGRLGSPERRYGPRLRLPPADGDLGPGAVLPQVRRYDMSGERPLVRVEAAGPATIVDGSADALAQLAAFGAVPSALPLFYAADRSGDELRAAARAGAELVVSDTNRRRVIVMSRPRQDVGPTLAAGEEISSDAALLDPFDRGPDAQTVAEYEGARYVRAPSSPNFPQFPEHRPFAAFDGSTETWWAADQNLDDDRHWIEIGFERPRDVPWVEVLPQRAGGVEVTELEVDGRRFGVRPGWNRLRLDLGEVDSLRLRIAAVREPREGLEGLAGALAEVRLPGVEVEERLRPPLLLTTALRREDLARSGLTYLFSRTTGDDPYRRAPRQDPSLGLTLEGVNQEALLVAGAGDAETGIARVMDLPVARGFRADAWLSVAPDAPDDGVDRLAGTTPPGAAFRSSGRYQGVPRRRASRAFDGDPASAWIAPQRPGLPWLSWRGRGTVTLRSLRLTAPGGRVAAPAAVRLRWPGGATPRLRVGPGGRVRLAQRVRSRSFRLEVLEPERAGGAVGIAELRAPGLPSAPPSPGGALRGRCGQAEVRMGDARVALRLAGPVAALERGAPLRGLPCGAGVRLPSGRHLVEAPGGLLRVDLLRLRSEPPAGPIPARGGGRVLDSGDEGRGSYDGVRLAVSGPAWLVLGESHNRGWSATCDGESLGEPVAIDGFANGWRASRGCERVELTFAPNAWMRVGFATSILVCLALLVLVVAASLRARRAPRRSAAMPARPEVERGDPGEDRPRRLPLRRALVIGALAGLVAAYVFALRAGLAIGPLVALVLWRGVGARPLLLTGAAILGAVVPLLYLVRLPEGVAGYDSEYAAHLMAAHWATVAAVVLMGLALWRILMHRRTRRPAGPSPPAPPG